MVCAMILCHLACFDHNEWLGSLKRRELEFLVSQVHFGMIKSRICFILHGLHYRGV